MKRQGADMNIGIIGAWSLWAKLNCLQVLAFCCLADRKVIAVNHFRQLRKQDIG